MDESQQELSIFAWLYYDCEHSQDLTEIDALVRSTRIGFTRCAGFPNETPLTDHAKATAIIADLRARLEAVEKELRDLKAARRVIAEHRETLQRLKDR